jgi:hypothetical protein
MFDTAENPANAVAQSAEFTTGLSSVSDVESSRTLTSLVDTDISTVDVVDDPHAVSEMLAEMTTDEKITRRRATLTE